ncbi:MAG: T9SS C-terminal target domain-containing protein, partial [Bacteroidetes bacterium]|nr:T9SS C-terminal target domain-containing protein [Bacteroidota bacterium]
DVDADDIYNPSAGDYPFIYGDQSIWFVTNDKGNAPGSGGTPIGMEIQTQAFGYRSNDELNNMTFYTNKIINRSSITLNNCFMAQWVDPDLGQATDDFVGCDVPRGLGICYNGDDDDEGIQGYGVNPPSIGIDFFEGPFSDLNDGIDNDRDGAIDEIAATGCDPEPRTERIIMAKFLYFNNDGTPIGNPSTAEHAYNYMVGKWKDNSQMVYGGTGYPGSVGATTTPAGLMFPGASDRAYGWSIGGSVQNPIAPPFDWDENNPGPGAQANVPADRRFVQSAGPFTLVPGAVNYITIGVVWARASSGGARGSFNQLLRADSKAQALFDACFKTIDGPDAPDVSVTELDQELILSFSYRPTSNNYNLGYREIDPVIQALNRDLPPGTPLYDSVYKFEGFKVYQLSASNVSTGELDDPSRARLLYQGDLNNGVSRIINWSYDLDMEQSVPFIAVDGANEGVRMTLRVTRDLFAEGSDRLVNFKRYYYLVVAYAY